MILVDTCVWLDHLRGSDEGLMRLLTTGRVCIHPMIVGELALGRLRNRIEVLGLLHGLPEIPCATDAEVLAFVEGQKLFGHGLGWVDAHLLPRFCSHRGPGSGPGTGHSLMLRRRLGAHSRHVE